MISVSARRLVARALGGGAVDVGALVAARRACGSWRRLSEVLQEERLFALLGFHLGEYDLPAGGDFKETLRSRARDVLAANLGRLKFFEALRDILMDAGIPALPIKGVDVAFASYPSPACRPMTDVDILVSPESYKTAGDVLQKVGFVPLPKEPRWWPARTYGRTGEMVDLHWSPAAAAPPRRETASITFRENKNGATDEFRLLVSVCHHQNHFFSLPLLDYYEALMLASRVSWPSYWLLARRWGALRATRFVLALGRFFFGGKSSAGKFGILKTLARPAFSGADVGRGRRAAAVYALSLDNPVAALGWSIRRPNWTRQILTRGSSAKSSSTSKKEKAL